MSDWNQRQIEGIGLFLVATYLLVAAQVMGKIATGDRIWGLFGQLTVAISIGAFLIGVFLFYT